MLDNTESSGIVSSPHTPQESSTGSTIIKSHALLT